MSKTRDSDRTVIDSTGDVFADLDLPMTEEEMLKIEIASAITHILQRKGWTQADVGKMLGVSQPDVSHLLKGRLKRFSVAKLFYFLLVLGFNVDIRIRKEPTRDRGKITVAA